MTKPSILWFEDIAISDVPIVSGKNASLGKMVRELGKSGVRVPAGFAATAGAYRNFLAKADIEPAIEENIRRYRSGEVMLHQAGSAICKLTLTSRIPDELVGEVRAAYDTLGARVGVPEPAVAVRSSAATEDLPDASRRAAGNLPQRAQPPRPARRLPALFRLAVYRSRHQLARPRVSNTCPSRALSASSRWCAPTSPDRA